MRNFTFVLLNKVKIESLLFALKTSLQVAGIIKLSLMYSTFWKGRSDLTGLFSWQVHGKTCRAFLLSLLAVDDCEKCRYKTSTELRKHEHFRTLELMSFIPFLLPSQLHFLHSGPLFSASHLLLCLSHLAVFLCPKGQDFWGCIRMILPRISGSFTALDCCVKEHSVSYPTK